MTNPKFSIIVPVYNVKEYLKECLSSLVGQTYKNFEILLIDDGSTDGSGEMCDMYKNDFIHVIHQRNAGLSAARNTGIKAASGEYLVFVDSDDYISSDALEHFCSVLRRYTVDILYARAFRLLPTGEIVAKRELFFENEEPMTGIQYYEEALRKNAMNACAPFSVCRREWLIENNLYFESGLLHEDELWTPKAYYMAKSVQALNIFFYYHRVREGSITQTTDTSKIKKNGLDLLYICRKLEEFSRKYKVEESKWLRNNISMLYKTAVFHSRLDQTHKNEIDRCFPIRNAWSKKEKIKSIVFWISPSLYCRLDQKTKSNRTVNCGK